MSINADLFSSVRVCVSGFFDRLLHISLRSRGVVITRCPTYALSLVPLLSHPSGLQRVGNTDASTGPQTDSINFPRLSGLFLVRRSICSIPCRVVSQ